MKRARLPADRSGERGKGQGSAALAEELALLIDGATNYAIYMLDPDGRITIWNRGAERIKGWTEGEIIGRYFAIFYTADDIAAGKPREDLLQASRAGRVEEESWRVRKDGSEFLASVTITALRDEAGALRGFGKVVRDITDQKAAEIAVIRREQHLRSILTTVPDAMIVMNEDGIISSFSTTAERIFGYSQAEVAGRNVAMLMPEQGQQHHDAHLHEYGRTGLRHVIGTVRREMAVRKSGETFPIELAVGEASVAGERIFTGFIRDLTVREEAERKLHELRTELIHVSRISAMGTMASTLAHEINQPLTAIANYLQTAREMTAEGADHQDYEIAGALDLATAQSLRAGAIIRRLRAFVEDGEPGLRVERLDTIVEEAISLALLGAAAAGIDVTVTTGAERVMVDRIQIEQVLVNLIGNAIQSMGSVPRRQLLVATAPDRAGWIRVSVSDTGRGIDPDMRERLFQAFASTKKDGMGLGLSICRTIVEAHGGRIWADPVATGGTAVHFCLRLAETGDE